ncbi:MAG: glycoside hydrolase family 5 protein [Fibrobacterota bacterium]
MKKHLIMMAGLLINAALFAEMSELSIDNFNDNDSESELGTYWYSFSDAASGGKTEGGISVDSQNLHAHWILEKGEWQWDPYFNWSIELPSNNDVNPEEWAGISYRYRGNEHTFMAEMESISDYAFHQKRLPASQEWREVYIAFDTDLVQPSWGVPVDFEPADLFRFSWRYTGTSGDTGNVSIDDVRFVDSIPARPRQYDMSVQPADIPARTSPDSGEITHPLQKRALKYLDKGVNLSSWLETTDPFDGFRYDEERMQELAEMGFLGIRLPIDLDKWVINRDSVARGTAPFAIDDELFMILDSFDIWTQRHDLSLTIDYHQYDKSLNEKTVTDPGYRAMVAQLWKAVAAHFSDNRREDLFFELTNEPGIHDPIPNDEWRVLAEEMRDSIRSVDAERPLLYGDSRWYNVEELIQEEPFAPHDPNIIYVFHFYEPFIFTHLGADWSGLFGSRNVTFPYDSSSWNTEFSYFGIGETTADWIKDAFRNYYSMGNEAAMYNNALLARNWAVRHNVPLICNEFGAYDKSTDVESRRAYFQAATSVFNDLDVPWQVWFGTFDDSGQLLPGMAEALGLRE